MDRLDEYRAHVTDVIQRHAGYHVKYGDVTLEAITDRDHDHYQVMMVGWDNNERVHSSVIHIDIIDGKIWIQEDATEAGIANEFVERGVPKEDIVLGFHLPYKRPYTGFGLN